MIKVFQWNSNVCFLTCVCLRQRVNNNTMSLFHCCETDRVTSGLKTLYVSFSSNQCQMLPPAPAGCHSNRPWPMRAGLSSSLPPSLPAEYQRLGGEEESSPSFCCSPSVHLYLSPAAAPSHSAELLKHPQLYNGERGTVGRVSALLELQCVCGYSHPEGWYVSLWLSEWRFYFGRGRRWNVQSPVPAQTLILLRLPLLPAICKYSFINTHLHACCPVKLFSGVNILQVIFAADGWAPQQSGAHGLWSQMGRVISLFGWGKSLKQRGQVSCDLSWAANIFSLMQHVWL